LDDGPFHYSIGSHRLSLRRLGWEYVKSNAAAAVDKAGKSGAFRGPARTDARRLSLYGSLRPQAFLAIQRWMKQHQ
jgi:hypothetical protein